MAKKKQPKKSPYTFLNTLALPAILLLTVVTLYPGISNHFVSLDDPAYVLDNPYIKSLSFESIGTIFSTFYNANYHPLTTLVYAIEWHFFKMDAGPYHFINLLLHLFNTALVYFLILRLNAKPVVAAIVAVLFAIHPLHVESVVWISELKDVLNTAFLLAGLLYYLKYLRSGKASTFIACLFFFLLSLLSKPAAVIFPLLLFVIDYYQKRQWTRKIFLEKIPFLVLSLIFGIVTMYAQKSGGAIQADLMPSYTLVQRFFIVCYGIVFYIVKLFVPIGLNAFYYAPKELPSYFYLSPIVIAGIIFWIWKTKTLKSELIFGFLFYVAGLILVVQIIPVGYAVVAERYSYVPYIGLFFIVGSFIPPLKGFRGMLFFAFLLALCVLSYQRTKVWKDSLTLFQDIAEKNPTSAYALFDLGKVYDEQHQYQKAIDIFSQAISMDSTYAEYYFYRGNSLYASKEYDKALADYLRSVQLKPEYVEGMNNVAAVYQYRQQYPEAIDYLSRAIKLRPNEYLHKNRATSYFYLKQYREALNDYNKSIEMNPGFPDVFFNRGVSYFYLQDTVKACQDWRKAASMGYTDADQYIKAYCK